MWTRFSAGITAAGGVMRAEEESAPDAGHAHLHQIAVDKFCSFQSIFKMPFP